jgi:hypothetical protein
MRYRDYQIRVAPVVTTNVNHGDTKHTKLGLSFRCLRDLRDFVVENLSMRELKMQ